MLKNADKTGFSKEIIGFISVYFTGASINKTLFIATVMLLLSCNIFCQCAGHDFRDEINAVYNSSTQTSTQLNKLLQLEQQMKGCRLEKDSSFMFVLQKIGILYFRQSDYTHAIDYTIKSILTAKICFTNHLCNELALINNYYNLYYYYGKTGQLKEKYNAIDSCIVYALRGNTGFEIIIYPLEEKIEYLFNKGEYSLCSKDAKLGEEIVQKYYHGKDSTVNIVYFINKQANSLYYDKNISSAKTLLENKISEFQQIGDSNYLGGLYTLLGLINKDCKNYSEAFFYLQKGYKVDSIINFKKGCAQSFEYIGILYTETYRNYKTALSYFNKALRYADASDTLYIFRQTGNVYALNGLFEKALDFYQRAYNTVHQGMNEVSMLQSSFQFPGFNYLEYLSALTTDKAYCYLLQYYRTKNNIFLKKAINIYKLNDEFLAKIKTEQQLDLASNLTWRTLARNLYEHAIEACYANNNIDDAFYFFEKSRAILLNDQINEQRWMADTDIAKQAILKKAIIELDNTLNTTPASSDDYLKIQKELYIKNQQFDILTNSIKNKNPLYYKSYLDTSFITLSQLRKNILSNNKTLLEIFSGDSAVYVLTIKNNDQTLLKLNKQLYDSLTRSFTSFIASRYVLNEHFKDFIKTAHQLYNLLFQNIKSPDGSIIISPDGVNYPFEALAINNDDHNPDYFLNHYATSYTYSVKYLTNQFAANASDNNSVLGIAPVQYNYQNLAELSGSDASLKNINKYFSNATNLVLEKATRNGFLQNFPNYNIIQLYTHASDTSMNNDPVIYFSDSALYLSSLIPDRKPVTQLVILSACETANGKFYEGEGIFSFNRGFAALGIPAAISNLWSVDNESTYQITELFYKYLSRGAPTDVALQKAKLEFINTTSSQEKKLPYFWAGSILTGKVDIIKSDNAFPWIKWIIITILLLGFFYFVRRAVRH